MRFQYEDVTLIWQELQPLLHRQWQEVACVAVMGDLHVNADAYRRLQGAGALHVTTARCATSGGLVGYAAYVLSRNLHYSQHLVAEADVFYLVPERRRGLAGLQLLREAEGQLRARGVGVICQKVKAAHDCGVLFRRMGYTLMEHVYVKGVQ